VIIIGFPGLDPRPENQGIIFRKAPGNQGIAGIGRRAKKTVAEKQYREYAENRQGFPGD
jgi:hypothetical protein